VYEWESKRKINVFGLDDRGFGFREGMGIFLFTTAFRPALGPTQPPIQWVPAALSFRLKWPDREVDHSPPSSTEIKNAWRYTSTPPVRIRSVYGSAFQMTMFLRTEDKRSRHDFCYPNSSERRSVGHCL
jgi:hypothetical protein